MKNILKSIIVLAIIFLFALINLQSQTWEQEQGPYGGAVKQLMAHKNYLYALTYEQLYRSSDDGVTWQNIPTSQNLAFVNAITSQNSMLFIATSNEGILRSKDDGKTWEKQNNGLTTNNSIKTVVSNGINLFAQTEKNNLYKSTNNGNNWVEIKLDTMYFSSQLKSYYVQLKVIQSEAYILVYTYTNEVKSNIFKTNDNGETWYPILSKKQSSNFPNDFQINDFSINDSIINFCYNKSYSIKTSTDFGETWLPKVNKFIYNNTSCVINTGKTIVAGLNRNQDDNDNVNGYSLIISNNKGVSWDTLNPQFRNIISLFQYKNFLFATTYEEEGILRSSDNGLNWEKSNFGLNAHTISSIVVQDEYKFIHVNKHLPFNSRIIPYQLFRKNNKNVDWEQYQDSLYPKSKPFLVNKDNIIVKSDSGIYLTKDFGKSWNLQSLQTFKYDLNYANNLFISMHYNDTSKHRYFEIYKSTDLCKNWQVSSSTFDSQISQLTYHNDAYYAFINNNIIKSLDTGSTWNFINTPYEAGHLFSHSKYLFLYSRNLYRMNLDGSGWDSLKLPMSSTDGINLLSYNNDTLICLINSSTKVNIYQSIDNGDNWIESNLKFPNTLLGNIPSYDNKLYAGTQYSGLWSLDLSKTNIEQKDYKEQIEIKVYPNPSQGKFTIERNNIMFLSTQPISYSLKSITGQEVLSFISSEEKLELKTNNLQSGIYYLTAEQGNKSITQIITVLK